jgi:hypothetical protein
VRQVFAPLPAKATVCDVGCDYMTVREAVAPDLSDLEENEWLLYLPAMKSDSRTDGNGKDSEK